MQEEYKIPDIKQSVASEEPIALYDVQDDETTTALRRQRQERQVIAEHVQSITAVTTQVVALRRVAARK